MILVTGATGNVGAAVVRELAARGRAFRVAARKPRDERSVRFDFVDPATFAPALAGCRAVFLLRPPAIADTRRTLNPFIDAARAHGVEHIVFLSVVGAHKNRWMPHHAVEQRLRDAPGGWTILQPGFFAQNFGDAYRCDIVREARIYLPAGAGRVAFIDVRDAAEVAVQALVNPEAHARCAYVLTGAEAVSFNEAALMLAEELRRDIRYQPASIAGYLRHLRRAGRPWRQAAVQTVLHTGLRFGQAERVDSTLARLLGRPPRTLAEYFHDHRALWLDN